MVTAKISKLKSENTTQQKKLWILFKTNAKTKGGLAKDPEKTRDDLGKKTREREAVRAKAGELEKGLAFLRDAPKVKHEKIKGLET